MHQSQPDLSDYEPRPTHADCDRCGEQIDRSNFGVLDGYVFCGPCYDNPHTHKAVLAGIDLRAAARCPGFWEPVCLQHPPTKPRRGQ